MARWEYCEVWWQPQGVLVNFFNLSGASEHRFPANQWPSTFARLGVEGWELVGMMSSPTGAHEYWYYFKRQLASN